MRPIFQFQGSETLSPKPIDFDFRFLGLTDSGFGVFVGFGSSTLTSCLTTALIAFRKQQAAVLEP